ncbi:MAG: DUF4174 domain-containing protein [Deltaproteobacteria bacterium]|nr:DUF4174 domain-containing protein [Deltaproteobacteria bacterium]
MDLDSLRWKNRILILFSPSASDRAHRLQKQELESRSRETAERDLLIVDIFEEGESRAGSRVLSKVAAETLRGRFAVQRGAFQLILIGKDGTVKLRSDQPGTAKDIFGLIDSMPMRHQELEGKKIPSS